MTLIEKLQKAGIRRVRTLRGFRYDYAGGSLSVKERERIAALKIPPAWTEVAISASAHAKLQAVGKDAAGRWQYLYHAAHVKRQEEEKFQRLLHFAEALPKMRKAVARDLAHPGLGREKVLACILRILSTCFIRSGSEVYASENGSYGIATLRRKHVSIEGDLVRFDFPGKSGKRQQRELRDPRVARIVRELIKLPGYEVFKFQNAAGEIQDVRRAHINEYIKEVMGERFSAKDFRTWAGTLICACALARAGAASADSKTARMKKVRSAIKEAAEHLGNTPAICRSSYIYPSVLNSFECGRVVERYFETLEELVEYKSKGLHHAEKALLQLLKDTAD